MTNKKVIAILVAVTAIAAISIAQIYVPENFEKPVTFRISAAIMKLLSFGVNFSVYY